MRLHPLSVPYRAFETGSKITGTIFAAAAFTIPLLQFQSPGLLTVLASAAVPGYALGTAWALVYYLKFDYSLSSDTFAVDSGVVSRQSVRIPLNRIQNVDVKRGALQRLLGLSKVSIETAGDTENASLRYLGRKEAEEFREHVRSGRGTPSGDRTLFRLLPSEVGIFALLSVDFRVLAVITTAISLLPLVDPDNTILVGVMKDLANAESLWAVAVAVGLWLCVAFWATGVLVKIFRYHGFEISRVGDALEYRRGLLKRYEGSIPLDKIQTTSISEPLVKRALGYASMSVETAGYGPDEKRRDGTQTAVPLGRRDRVLRLARDVHGFGELSFTRPPKKTRRRYTVKYVGLVLGLTAALWLVSNASQVGFVPTVDVAWYLSLVYLPLAPVAAHYKWKSRGYHLGRDHIVTRNGFWVTRTKVVPYYRVQNVIENRTVLQRRWGLGTVTVDTAGSYDFNAKAVDINMNEADQLLDIINFKLQKALLDGDAHPNGFDTAEDEREETEPVPKIEMHEDGSERLNRVRSWL